MRSKAPANYRKQIRNNQWVDISPHFLPLTPQKKEFSKSLQGRAASTTVMFRFEDAIDAFKMIFDGEQSWLLGWTIGNMFSIAVFNYAGQMSDDVTTIKEAFKKKKV